MSYAEAPKANSVKDDDETSSLGTDESMKEYIKDPQLGFYI